MKLLKHFDRPVFIPAIFDGFHYVILEVFPKLNMHNGIWGTE